AEQLVARLVAEAVVDQPETVEVDRQHGDGMAMPLGAGERQLEMLGEHLPVGQAGRGIVWDRCSIRSSASRCAVMSVITPTKCVTAPSASCDGVIESSLQNRAPSARAL